MRKVIDNKRRALCTTTTLTQEMAREGIPGKIAE